MPCTVRRRLRCPQVPGFSTPGQLRSVNVLPRRGQRGGEPRAQLDSAGVRNNDVSGGEGGGTGSHSALLWGRGEDGVGEEAGRFAAGVNEAYGLHVEDVFAGRSQQRPRGGECERAKREGVVGGGVSGDDGIHWRIRSVAGLAEEVLRVAEEIGEGSEGVGVWECDSCILHLSGTAGGVSLVCRGEEFR